MLDPGSDIRPLRRGRIIRQERTGGRNQQNMGQAHSLAVDLTGIQVSYLVKLGGKRKEVIIVCPLHGEWRIAQWRATRFLRAIVWR